MLAIVLVHSLGHFAYMGLWRHLAAPDFDVNDFKAYYTAALAVRTGQADRFLYSDPGLMNLGLLPEQPWVQFAVANGIPHPSAYIYPPFFAVALAPLTLMDYHTANQAWFGLNTLLLAGSILLLVRLAALPWPGVPTAGGVSPARAGGGAMAAACVVFVSLNFFPTIRAMQCGQAGPLLLLLTTVGLYAALRGRDALAGGALAIAAAVKLTPAILLVYLWWAGRRRAALWGAGVLVLLTLVAVFAAGWDNHVRYASEFVPTLSKGAATYANQSINGALNRLLTGASMAQFEFSQEPALVRFLTRAIGLLLLGAALFIARPRARETSPGSRLALGYGLVTLTTLMIAPISWEHHYVLALLPLALAIGEASGEEAEVRIGAGRAASGRFILLAAAYVLMSLDVFELVRRNLPYLASRAAMSYVLLGAAILWALIATSLARTERTA